jgi:hypothetical protein
MHAHQLVNRANAHERDGETGMRCAEWGEGEESRGCREGGKCNQFETKSAIQRGNTREYCVKIAQKKCKTRRRSMQKKREVGHHAKAHISTHPSMEFRSGMKWNKNVG